MDKDFDKEFLNYFKKPLPKDEINSYYKISKIEEPKVVLLRNIVTSLFSIICDTYLGDNIMGLEDREHHFEWCWNNLKTKLYGVNVKIDNKTKFKKWVKEVCFDIFYDDNEKENEDLLDSMKELWESILEMNYNKSKSDLDLLVDVYNFYYKTIDN